MNTKNRMFREFFFADSKWGPDLFLGDRLLPVDPTVQNQSSYESSFGPHGSSAASAVVSAISKGHFHANIAVEASAKGNKGRHATNAGTSTSSL